VKARRIRGPEPGENPYTVIAALLIVGALLELLGLGLVAWDVYDARRQRVALSRQDQLVQVGTAIEHNRALGMTVVGGATETPPVPPLEERVATLEGELEQMGRRLDQEAERHVRDHRAMSDEFAKWVAEGRREVFDLEQKLRPMIGGAAAGNIKRRGIGVGLFALGLIIQMAANVAAL
jgi:hypothetical protein